MDMRIRMTNIMKMGLDHDILIGSHIIPELLQSAVKKTLVLLAVLQLAVYSIRAITFMTRTKANVSATA